jgi:branched-chain amino acid transport system permease protein
MARVRSVHVLQTLVVIGLVALPWLGASSYLLTTTTFMGMFALLAMGLNVLIGNAGQASLGQAAFFGLGAYTYAIFAGTYRWPIAPVLVLSVLVPAVCSVGLGWLVLRLSGHYLAMATLAFAVIAYRLFLGLPFTGAAVGLQGIPVLPVAALPDRNLPNLLLYYYITWAVVGAAGVFTAQLIGSRFGRALAALRADETAAAMLGVSPTRHKIQALVISAAYGGLAGALFTSYQTSVDAAAFTVERSLDLVIMVVLGGLGSVFGSLLGAIVWTLLPELLRANFLPELVRNSDQLRLFAYGLALVLIIILWPRGIMGGFAALGQRLDALAASWRSGRRMPGLGRRSPRDVPL